MRYKSLKFENKVYESQSLIDKILSNEGFHWLLDSEIENAELEIKNSTIIWKGGTYYAGNWHYGIWENGTFSGRWINGIFVQGEFKGTKA